MYDYCRSWERGLLILILLSSILYQNTLYMTMKKQLLFSIDFFLSHSNIDLTDVELPNEDTCVNDKFINHVDVSETAVADLINNVDQNKQLGLMG